MRECTCPQCCYARKHPQFGLVQHRREMPTRIAPLTHIGGSWSPAQHAKETK